MLTLLVLFASFARAGGFPPPPPFPAVIPPAARLSGEEKARADAAFARIRAAPGKQDSAEPELPLPAVPENIPAAPALTTGVLDAIADSFARIAMAGATRFTSLGSEPLPAAIPQKEAGREPASEAGSPTGQPEVVASATVALSADAMLHLELEPLSPESAVAAAIAATEEPDLFRRVHAKYGELVQR